ncbi:CRAL/TRIO domain [Popillia japonica]|uniref:CRAL/TRIO domain n=1 Tax=Popillia japonica TaxID=7064 RepID=A0AAW1MIK7_POPJA
MSKDNISEKYKNNMTALKEWLIKQPHLPQNIDQQNLSKFLFSCNNSVEQAKRLIDLNFTLRSLAPELFSNRDPQSEELKRAFTMVDYCPLPKFTPKNYKLFLFRLKDANPDNFVYADIIKAFFMVADLRMYTDFEESDGEVPIFDMAGYTLRHLTKINLSILRKYMAYTQEAHPVRLREIHIVNVPPFLDKCLMLVKPLLKSEVSKLIHYHTPNSTTLFDYIPRNLLPEDYGGTLEKTEHFATIWRKKVLDNRDFYVDDSRWKVIESKRPNSSCYVDKTSIGLEVFSK